jgi:hypothetical protein
MRGGSHMMELSAHGREKPALQLRTRKGCLYDDLRSELGREASEVECDREVGSQVRTGMGDETGQGIVDWCRWLTHGEECNYIDRTYQRQLSCTSQLAGCGSARPPTTLMLISRCPVPPSSRPPATITLHPLALPNRPSQDPPTPHRVLIFSNKDEHIKANSPR